MARIRTFKPELLKHEELFDLEQETNLPMRIAWAGLFTACDREGRFKWRPRQLKVDILPYDNLDFAKVLDAFWKKGMIVKYRVDSEDYGYIPTWHKHQVINNRENESTLPPPPETFSIEPVDASLTRGSRVVHVMSTRDQSGKAEGKGKEGEGKGKDPAPSEAGADESLHIQVREFIKKCITHATGLDPAPWNAKDAKYLKQVLDANPSWKFDTYKRLIQNKFRSDEPRGDPAWKWLPQLSRYADGPLDRFGKLAGNGNEPTEKPSYIEQRINAAFGRNDPTEAFDG